MKIKYFPLLTFILILFLFPDLTHGQFGQNKVQYKDALAQKLQTDKQKIDSKYKKAWHHCRSNNSLHGRSRAIM